MSRFDYDGPLTTARRCANHRDRPAVVFVQGAGYCVSCAGRADPAPRFVPPPSHVGTHPGKRAALSRQAQTDFITAAVDRVMPKSSPSDRSVFASTVQVAIAKTPGSEQVILPALMSCRTKEDIKELLDCVRQRKPWTPPDKSDSAPPPIVPCGLPDAGDETKPGSSVEFLEAEKKPSRKRPPGTKGTVESWLAERTVKNQSARLEVGEACAAYKMYVEDTGVTPVSKVEFGRRMAKLGHKSKLSHGRRYYAGLKLREPEPE